ncbi:uncharacterized protein PAC_11792 [Phialocephala subalpina]|uniref:NmrA-like domain-containing protein n=1 Tax=Phialocephala subalpina TaxID=576137 RepID=A0A1L7XA39_9HELO|nr:uncharacterized protein PAC_11792 [Phialocephala subalpina]
MYLCLYVANKGYPYAPKESANSMPRYLDSNAVARSKSEIIKEVQKMSLEYTIFYNGIFLDYYGSPHFKSHVTAWPLFVDISHESAAIPCSGNELIVFTHSSDLAEFTVKSLDLKDWPKESYVIGEKLTWKEFVKLAEDAKGTYSSLMVALSLILHELTIPPSIGSKFNVVYDSEADLKAGRVSQLPSYPAMYAASLGAHLQATISIAGERFAKAELDLKPAHTLNDDFPEIKSMSVKKFLELSWKGH